MNEGKRRSNDGQRSHKSLRFQILKIFHLYTHTGEQMQGQDKRSILVSLAVLIYILKVKPCRINHSHFKKVGMKLLCSIPKLQSLY